VPTEVTEWHGLPKEMLLQHLQLRLFEVQTVGLVFSRAIASFVFQSPMVHNLMESFSLLALFTLMLLDLNLLVLVVVLEDVLVIQNVLFRLHLADGLSFFLVIFVFLVGNPVYLVVVPFCPFFDVVESVVGIHEWNQFLRKLSLLSEITFDVKLER